MSVEIQTFSDPDGCHCSLHTTVHQEYSEALYFENFGLFWRWISFCNPKVVYHKPTVVSKLVYIITVYCEGQKLDTLEQLEILYTNTQKQIKMTF